MKGVMGIGSCELQEIGFGMVVIVLDGARDGFSASRSHRMVQ